MSDVTQTESYIVLKPIAERFSKIANSMTDDEIKMLIKNGLKEQLDNLNLGDIVADISSNWIAENEETIRKYTSEAIRQKFQSL